MNYKNILKVSLAVWASVAVLSGCAKKEFEDISEDSDNLFERGLYRSTYQYFLDHHNK